MSVYNNIVLGKFAPLASAVRNASQTINGQDLVDPTNSGGNRSGINTDASGLVAYLNVTVAPGVETLQLVLEEQDPASGVWSQVAASTASAVTGMVRLKCKPSITAVAPSTSGVTVQDILPGTWRLRVVHSAAGNWTYSVGVVVYC